MPFRMGTGEGVPMNAGVAVRPPIATRSSVRLPGSLLSVIKG